MRRRTALHIALLLGLLSGGSVSWGVASDPRVDAALDAIAAERYSAAARNLKKPAEGGDAEAQYLLARLYYAGRGVKNDPERGERLLRAAAEGGWTAAQFALGGWILKGHVAGSPAEARTWFESAAAGGEMAARRELGRGFLDGTFGAKDPLAALRWFGSCADHDAECALFLGSAYAGGHGVERDEARAAGLFRGAADAGLDEATVEYARMLLDGRGVERDPAAAVVRLEAIADDSRDAADLLAGLYAAGDVVPADPLRAFELAKVGETIADAAAALSGDDLDRAYRGVARLESQGRYLAAIDRLRALAHRDVKPAQLLLGRMLALGHGAPQDPPQALQWLELSGMRSNPDARVRIERLGTVLTQEERDRVMAVVAAWRPAPWRPERGDAGRASAGVGPVSDPSVISKTVPVYPEEARAARQSGTVTLQVLVSADGRVLDPFVISVDPPRRGFEAAALDAVAQWRYEPGRQGDTPIEMYFTVIIAFDLG